MNQQSYRSPTLSHVQSPTLDALCQDLDMFIHELCSNNTSQEDINDTVVIHSRDITPLDLNRPIHTLSSDCFPQPSKKDDIYPHPSVAKQTLNVDSATLCNGSRNMEYPFRFSSSTGGDNEEEHSSNRIYKGMTTATTATMAAASATVDNQTSSILSTTTSISITSSPTFSDHAYAQPKSKSHPQQLQQSTLTSHTTTTTPPMSPSFLGISSQHGRNDHQPLATTTRSSSLNSNKSFSSSSSSINLKHSHRRLPAPAISPLAFEITSPKGTTKTTTSKAKHAKQQHFSFFFETPNYALLSYMAKHFIKGVHLLNSRRKLYCTAEYPLSFSGEEALDLISAFSPSLTENKDRQKIYLSVAQSLMYCDPPLIVPIREISEKSVRKRKIYNSPTEMYTLSTASTAIVKDDDDDEEEDEEEEDNDDEDEDVKSRRFQGVYTPFTRCYSSSCLPGQPDCYSVSCPNKLYSLNGPIFKKLTAAGNTSIVSSSSHDTTLSRAWSATVSKDILKAMPEDEIKRQEAIHELIYTEDDYVRDLKILDVDFAKELLNSQCIEEDRKKAFHDKVLNNYQEILDIHDTLYKELRDYQAICQASSSIGLVDSIGGIFSRHVPRFMKAYMRYGPHVVLAEYYAKVEAETNMVFRHFIKAREQLAQCRRLPFRHFIILPVTRLQRYALLIGAVLKKTSDDHPDKKTLTECMETIRDVATKVDEATTKTKNTLRIYEIHSRIRCKAIGGAAGDQPSPQQKQLLCQLDLLKPGRRLIKEGILTRRSHIGVETIELHVFLFDHLLLMTKTKKSSTKGNDVEYVISKKPIPFELLHIQDATEGFSIGLRHMTSTYYEGTSSTNHLNDNSSRNGTGNHGRPMLYQHNNSSTIYNGGGSYSQTNNNNNNNNHFGSNSYPMLVQHLGRRGADYVLYAENAQARMDWKQKIVEAKADYEMAHKDKQVFDIRTLSDTAFAGSNTPSPHNHGKVTCTVPFLGPTGIRMIAIGTHQGIWIGIEGDTQTIRLAVALSDVQQIAVLEYHSIFLVLADRTLYAYALDSLLPHSQQQQQQQQQRQLQRNNNSKSPFDNKPYQKVAQHISFFHSGLCQGRTLVIAMKKRGVDSHFKVLEPICGNLRDPRTSSKFLQAKSSLLFSSKKMPDWFKTSMEFYIGTESYAIQFLKARVVIVCSRGFEIVNLEALHMNRNLPDLINHPDDFRFVLQRGEHNIRPLGMYRCREQCYLLCYNAFCFMVDIHGNYVKNAPLIEWEGEPQSVAFQYPFVIGFDARFIEVRHIETGELIQVLAGTHMRCLQFIHNQQPQQQYLPPIIHGCMAHPFKPDYQYIFQLAGDFTSSIN
ncbi:CNH domain-containing protein [Mycotypha africana]|uniref:CNH domain-containing protein n=1 Tax=Mycotypha africana TaxID=64632 RepID=UPI002301DB82|nr:CNH domain-containing protein [Mycotypha africana]KAI8973328.1 CNH domain-containing protein [Mycotypha africana]